VLADTEQDGHLRAFNETFEYFDLPVRWSNDEYAVKVLIGGGKERLKSLLTDEFIVKAGLPVAADEQSRRRRSYACSPRNRANRPCGSGSGLDAGLRFNIG
jgi:hypothetical protein